MGRAAPGVGPKVAARIVAELKDKAPDGASLAAALAVQVNGAVAADASAPMRDAISALVNLGYPQAQAAGAIATVAKELDDTATAERLIRLGLKELAR